MCSWNTRGNQIMSTKYLVQPFAGKDGEDLVV